MSTITTGTTVWHGKSTIDWTVASIDGATAIITRTVQSGPRNVYRQARRVRLTSLRLPVPVWGSDGIRWYCPCPPANRWSPRTEVAGKGVPCGPDCKGA